MRIICIGFTLLALLWTVLALQCSQKRSGIGGILWNYANGSVTGPIWNYNNGSILPPIWNPANPSYLACSSYGGETYRPENEQPNPVNDTAEYNPAPFCWTCHGDIQIMGFYNYTGMVHANGNPVTYGE
jgi:hypothetical protein